MKKFTVFFMMFCIPFTYPADVTVQEQCTKALKLEKHCPIIVGNKTFNKSDLEKFSEKRIDDLIEISNPPCCLRIVGMSHNVVTPFDVDRLKGMPKAIKKGMTVQRCSYDKIIDDTRVGRCANATTYCSVGAPAVEGCIWISTGCTMSTAVLWGLVCGWFGAAAAPCVLCSAYSCCEVCCCKDVCEEIVIG